MVMELVISTAVLNVPHGTLYSYGSRYTTGSVRKFPCPGGDGAAHSRVVECHGFSATRAPALRLMKKLTTKGSCARASPHAPQEITTFSACTPRPCAYTVGS